MAEEAKNTERTVLCGANSYEEKYYFNPVFSNLPKLVQDELKILCVLYTEDCGGILTLEFAPDGTLLFRTEVADEDYLYDEIDAGLRLKKLSEEKKELLESLELYYRVLFLHEAGAIEGLSNEKAESAADEAADDAEEDTDFADGEEEG